jgi:hypothetical protein
MPLLSGTFLWAHRFLCAGGSRASVIPSYVKGPWAGLSQSGGLLLGRGGRERSVFLIYVAQNF